MLSQITQEIYLFSSQSLATLEFVFEIVFERSARFIDRRHFCCTRATIDRMDCPQQSLPISFAVAAFVELLQQAVESLQIGATLLDEDCHQGWIFLRRYQRQRLGFDLLL